MGDDVDYHRIAFIAFDKYLINDYILFFYII